MFASLEAVQAIMGRMAFIGCEDIQEHLVYQSGSGAPTVDAAFIGQLYLDTSNNNIYLAKATGTGASDWLTAGISGLSASELDLLNNITATAAEINQAADNSVNCEIVTAANVITAAESGATFFLNSATEFASTLPAPALGLRYTFIVSAAPSGASYTIATNSSANIIKGQIFTSDVNSATDADFETSGGDTISFVDAKAVAGDTVTLISDGTNWFARGFCSVFDAITITTAS